MAVEKIEVNGVDLSNYASNIEDIGGMWKAPGLRGEDYEIPGRHGALRLPKRCYESGTLLFPIFLQGVDPTTGAITSSVDQLRDRARELVYLFQQDPLTIVHTYPDGSAVQAIGRLALEPMDFTRPQASFPAHARVALAVSVPGAFWTDTTLSSQTLSGTTGSTLSFTNFAGANAPMDELTVTFGPSINPKIVQGSVSLQYADVIDTGRTAVFNPDMTFAGTGGLSMGYAQIRHFGSGRWFELAPGAPPQVVFTHSGGGSASVTISGRRKYLIG